MVQFSGMLRFVLLLVLSFGTAYGHCATLYYLHGKIVEDQGDNAVHPSYGTYQYGAILQGLKQDGHTVISEVRASGTDPKSYAKGLADAITKQIADGTPPADIVVIGFSKGAQIGILVSQMLARTDVRFVFQAVCGSWVAHYRELKVYGNILSLYETSDSAGSCASLFARSKPITCEVAITTGEKHGAFYRPHADWMNPLRAWIAREYCQSDMLLDASVGHPIVDSALRADQILGLH